MLICVLVLWLAGLSALGQVACATSFTGQTEPRDGSGRRVADARTGLASTSRHLQRTHFYRAKQTSRAAHQPRDAGAMRLSIKSPSSSAPTAPVLVSRMSDMVPSSPRSKDFRNASSEPTSGSVAGAATPATLIPGLPTDMVASIVGLRGPVSRAVPQSLSDATPKSPTADRVPRPTSQDAFPSAGAAVGEEGTNCLLLPVGPAAGVAMFRRPSNTIVIVDKHLELLPAGGGDWWQTHLPHITRAAQWTTLSVPTASGEGIRIERRQDGLCLSGTREVPSSDANIAIQSRPARVLFAVERPGSTLAVTDPVTRSLLLVGTDDGSSGALRPWRRSALFVIDDALAGVVVEPFADGLQLHRTSSGFELITDGSLPIHVAPGFADAAIASVDGLTRTLTITAEPDNTLVSQMQDRALAAASAPVRSRNDRRLDLAEAMVGLGLGSEASSVLLTVAADDPNAAASPRAALLAAIASTLDKGERRPDPFAAAAYPPTEEGKLWRALAWQPQAPVAPAIATIRQGMPLLLSYPAHLREAAAIEAARVLLAGQDPDALRAIDLLPDSAAIRLARAEAAARLGHTATALASLAELARSRDLAVMAGGLRVMVRLNHASGQLTDAAAADLLDAHRLDWRVTGQEASALIEEADDRWRVPDARAAFELWTEALAVDPAVRDQVEPRRLAALKQLGDPAVASRVSASDYASIIAGSTAVIPPDGDLAARTSSILAEKYAYLGLDDHAAATLERLVKTMPAGTARATIDTRIASLDLAQGLPAAAGAALARDDDGGCLTALVDRRRLLRARTLDGAGKSAEALALLGSQTDEEATRLKAKLLMDRQDWHAAIAPLTDLFHHLPARGPLDAAQGAVVLQLVAASVRDGAPASSMMTQGIEPRLADPSERRSLAVLMAPLASSANRSAAAGASGI